MTDGLYSSLGRVARGASYGSLVGVVISVADAAMSGGLGHWAALRPLELARALGIASAALVGVSGMAGAGLALVATAIRHEPRSAQTSRGRVWSAGWDGVGAAFVAELYGVVWQSLSSAVAPNMLAPRFLAVHAVSALIGIGVASFSWRIGSWSRGRITLRLGIAIALLMQALYFFYRFSRSGSLAKIHAVIVIGVVVYGMLAFEEWTLLRAMPGRVCLGLATIPLVLAATTTWALNGDKHSVRLVVLERTSLAFQVVRLLPDIGGSKRSRLVGELSAGCAGSPAAVSHVTGCASLPAPSRPVRGVVLIIADCLRGDRVQTPRHGLTTLTPEIDRLSARATTYEKAYCTHPGTARAVPSLVTGRHPRTSEPDPIPEPFLGTLLRSHGIRSVAVSSHRYLRPSFRDFDFYDGTAEEERDSLGRNALGSPLVTRHAAEQLTQMASQRFLLAVHYYDAHAHYVANPLFRFGSTEESMYDGEVAYTDYWIGRLLNDLEKYPDVAVVLLGDHGEEFWEHHFVRHQTRLYDESTRVPLIISVPGQRGSRISCPVSTAAVLPTILDLLGVSVPSSVETSSLVRLPAQGEPALLESADGMRKGIVFGNWKLISDTKTGVVEFYDLVADPRERRNLADEKSLEMQALYCQMLLHFSPPLRHRLPAKEPAAACEMPD